MKQRKYPRFSSAYNAIYSNESAEMLLPCRILDISSAGSRIELFSKQTIAVGSTIELHIVISNIEKRIITTFKCLWSQPAKDSSQGYIIGGAFIGLSTQARQLLIDNAHETDVQSKA